jgi:hypothetical protein
MIRRRIMLSAMVFAVLFAAHSITLGVLTLLGFRISRDDRTLVIGYVDKAKLLEGPKPASISEYDACFGKPAQ